MIKSFPRRVCLWKGASVAFIAKVEGVVIENFSGGFAPDPLGLSITF